MVEIKKAAFPKVSACEGKTASIELVYDNPKIAEYQSIRKKCRRCIALQCFLEIGLTYLAAVSGTFAVLLWRVLI